MSVQDMIKKSVLESGMFSQYDIPKILAALAVALILGSVIYLVYQKFYVGVIMIPFRRAIRHTVPRAGAICGIQ